MALSRAEKWTIFLLMANHGNQEDDKSQFRTAVEARIANGQPPESAVFNEAQLYIPGIQSADVGALPGLTAANLRSALNFSDEDYDPKGGPCPDVNNQAAIVSRLLTLPD